ncbi:MAG: T9SS type A sorting domain-containing protein, partial [Bacteroidota bacterium]
NPASSQVFCQSIFHAKTQRIEIRSLEGKLLRVKEQNLKDHPVFSLDGIPAGYYLLHIVDDHQHYAQSLIIQP